VTRGGDDDDVDPIPLLLRLNEERRVSALAALTPPQRRELAERWARGWAQAGQLPTHDDWRVWLLMGGRGFGKTRAGAEWVSEVARRNGAARIALVGATIDEVRRVMIEGASGLLRVARAHETPRWRQGAGEVEFASGAVAYCYSAMTPEVLRGPEHHAAWCDEIAKWPRGIAAWDNLMMGMRLGEKPQVVVTTTPRSTPLVHKVVAMSGLTRTGGASRANAYLPNAFLEGMASDYAGTRLERQELDGELIEELEGALWTPALIERGRVSEAPPLVRVVVGVDPPAGSASGRKGDECGIVAVGLDRRQAGYVVEDASVAATSPEAWAAAVAACAARVGAHRVVAEANQGGQMVESVLRAADMGMPVTLVNATQGKVVRAEPVALLYEAGRVHHVGRLDALEDQLCGMAMGGGYEGPGRSPDRADALVWALTELMLGKKRRAGVRALD
jgi:phage terminase large subunit-like protein